MANYLIKVLILLFFSSFVVLNYYIDWPHIENFDWYMVYITAVWIIYIIYKYFQLNTSNKKTIFTPFWILNYFLLHLFVLCILFFHYNSWPLTWSLILFLKTIFYLVLPVSIILISISFWKKTLSIINSFLLHDNKKEKSIHNEDKTLSLILSIWIWFFSFNFLLVIIWMLWFYNLYVVFLILIIFIIFSYKQLIELFDWIINHKILLDIDEGSGIKIVTTEFLFIISTLILGVTLINIVRPFPIGWDDLWVYMNFPHLLAEAWSIISLWWMYSWQVFTWIWYMFDSPVQAFFLNAVWGFLSFITLVLITSDLLNNSEDKKDAKSYTFINIPLVVWAIFISMPMIVFQQAKDMKLDAWLFFISIICLYLVYKFFAFEKWNKKSKEICLKENHSKENNLKEKSCILLEKNILFFLIIWLLAWFAFSIKFTSLLLISAIIWVIFFARMWFLGFLGYLWIYFAIFTKLNLWRFMNVVVNPWKIQWFETYFSLISAWLWLWILTYVFYKNKKIIKKLFIEISIFLLWIIIALIPWLWKNIYDSYPNISLPVIIGWKVDSFNFDLKKIYSDSKIEEIKNKNLRESMTSSWTTSNEDFWRYFGYEEWVNNYVKLPWNLTMQNNQWWEFTDIWYIFLALIPLIFLFLPFKNKNYSYLVLLIALLEIFIFKQGYLTNLMSQIDLPLWYLFILLLFLIPLIYFNYLIKNNKLNYLFRLNFVFTTFYTFLWTISAFWIVWYWIVMYFSFLIMIAIWFYYLANYDIHTSKKDFNIKLFWSIIVFLIVSLYFLNSVFPHTFNNLKTAWYTEYKLWQMSTEEAPFLYHQEYLSILFELNIADDKKAQFINDNIGSNNIKYTLNQLNIKNDILSVIQVLNQFTKEDKITENDKIDAKKSIFNIYSWLLNPEDKYKNKSWIYRIWTFLKYHISENNKRLFEDSLIFSFNDYIYNKDPNKSIQNMKDLWLTYLLSDLNAATIDQDSNHYLTTRYENLLKTFVSDKLELIDTDSMCLRVALDDYKINKDIDKYMSLAWVNYESYKDWKTISRWEKALMCYEYMYNLLLNNKISEKSFSYLWWLKNYYEQNKATLNTRDRVLSTIHSNYWKSYKVLFKIK